MRQSQEPKTQPGELDWREPCEWRFDERDVPDSELVACCWWEYARESQSMRDFRQPVRELTPAERTKYREFWERLAKHINTLFVECVCVGGSHDDFKDDPRTDSFPNPWQSLSAAERKKRSYPVRLEHVRKPVETACHSDTTSLGEKAAAAHRKWCRTELPKASTNRRWTPAPVVNLVYHGMEVRAFNVLWEYFDNAKIKAAFAQWVDHNRPPTISEPGDGSGHKPIDWRKKLRDLGVMRLLNKCTVGQLPYRCPEASKYFSRWTDSQFSAARRRALNNFRELLGFLPKSELPIHASTAGGRARL